MYDWDTAGAVRTARPQLRCCTFAPRHVLWWGGVFLTLGALVLDMGTTARLAGQFYTVHYSKVQMVRRAKPCSRALLHFHTACCLERTAYSAR